MQTGELIRQLFRGCLELAQLFRRISFHVLKCLINLHHALFLLLDLAGRLVEPGGAVVEDATAAAES